MWLGLGIVVAGLPPLAGGILFEKLCIFGLTLFVRKQIALLAIVLSLDFK